MNYLLNLLSYDHEAYKLLKKCSDAKDMSEWNKYRNDNNEAPLNLKFVNLKDFFLAGANLKNVDMRGVSLEYANMNNANVAGANISNNFFWYLIFGGFLTTIIFLMTQRYAIEMLAIAVIIVVSITIIFLVFAGLIYNKETQEITQAGIILSILLLLLMGISEAVSLIYLINTIDSYFLLKKDYLDFFDSNILGIAFALFQNLIFIFLAIAIYKTNIINLKWIAKALNPEKVMGFKNNYLLDNEIKIRQDQIAMLKLEAEKTKDNEIKNLILKRIETIEKYIPSLIAQESDKKAFNNMVNNVIKELVQPYKYLNSNISTFIGLIAIFISGILIILVGFYTIIPELIIARNESFNRLFVIKDTLPDFGTIFGVIMFYGAPILLGISVVIYLIAQINKNLDKISYFQAQNRKIEEIQSIIKAKIALGLEPDEFKKVSNGLIDKLQESIMKNDCLSATQSTDIKSEPQFNYAKLTDDMRNIIKEVLKDK